MRLVREADGAASGGAVPITQPNNATPGIFLIGQAAWILSTRDPRYQDFLPSIENKCHLYRGSNCTKAAEVVFADPLLLSGVLNSTSFAQGKQFLKISLIIKGTGYEAWYCRVQYVHTVGTIHTPRINQVPTRKGACCKGAAKQAHRLMACMSMKDVE